MAAPRLCFCEEVLPQCPLNPSRTEDNHVLQGHFRFLSGMISPIALAFAVGLIRWAYRALKPPPPKICGSPDGSPITSPRIKLCNEGIWPIENRVFPRMRRSTKS